MTHLEAQGEAEEAQGEATEVAGVSVAVAMQPGAAGEAGQGGGMEAAGAEEEKDPPQVHHKAWEAERLRC